METEGAGARAEAAGVVPSPITKRPGPATTKEMAVINAELIAEANQKAQAFDRQFGPDASPVAEQAPPTEASGPPPITPELPSVAEAAPAPDNQPAPMAAVAKAVQENQAVSRPLISPPNTERRRTAEEVSADLAAADQKQAAANRFGQRTQAEIRADLARFDARRPAELSSQVADIDRELDRLQAEQTNGQSELRPYIPGQPHPADSARPDNSRRIQSLRVERDQLAAMLGKDSKEQPFARELVQVTPAEKPFVPGAEPIRMSRPPEARHSAEANPVPERDQETADFGEFGGVRVHPDGRIDIVSGPHMDMAQIAAIYNRVAGRSPDQPLTPSGPPPAALPVTSREPIAAEPADLPAVPQAADQPQLPPSPSVPEQPAATLATSAARAEAPAQPLPDVIRTIRPSANRGFFEKISSFLRSKLLGRTQEAARVEAKYGAKAQEARKQLEKLETQARRQAENRLKILKSWAKELLAAMPEVEEAIEKATAAIDNLEVARATIGGIKQEMKDYGAAIGAARKALGQQLNKRQSEQRSGQADVAAFTQQAQSLMKEMLAIADRYPNLDPQGIQALTARLEGAVEGRRATEGQPPAAETPQPAPDASPAAIAADESAAASAGPLPDDGAADLSPVADSGSDSVVAQPTPAQIDQWVRDGAAAMPVWADAVRAAPVEPPLPAASALKADRPLDAFDTPADPPLSALPSDGNAHPEVNPASPVNA